MLRSWLVVLCVLGFGLVGCTKSDDAPPPAAVDAGPGGHDTGPIRCGVGDDPDGDFISTMDEGEGDADNDGTPNAQDEDSDGDGFPDREEAGDSICTTEPNDTDRDGTPDFLDTDANGDGVPDRDQFTADTDSDGVPDWRDNDIDGDGINNTIERGDGATPVDTDNDGTPDIRDLDSDGDSIRDLDEGASDIDRDGTANFRDLDSDEDSLLDALEAGDADLMTVPAVCAREIDPVSGEVVSDGSPDFIDGDSDNDGFDDRSEVEVGTDPCNIDTDGDGLGDLAEGAYERINCPDGTTGQDCGCASSAGCRIPDRFYYVVLPYGGPAVERELEFGTTIRVADIFFVTDTTGSMGGTVENVKRTVTTPVTGLVDRIGESIPDAWFGGGQHDDFPFGGYGGGADQPLILAIRMTPPSMSAAVQTAFNGIGLHGGGDGPESQTEALYQIITGVGASWTYSGRTYNLRAYRDDCLETGYGAPCFREAALPIIVHFTDICSHNGPPGEASSCQNYTGITPAPATWEMAIAALNTRGAKYVGINATSSTCAGVVGPSGSLPCYFMKRTAEETGSIDLDMNPLVYDLPNGTSSTLFADTIVGAIDTIAKRVPLDVDTALRDEGGDDVDARRFIVRRQPSCTTVRPPTTDCWTEPEGVTHDQAVAFVDQSTFFGVVPGTLVRFRITFRNTFQMGGTTSQIYVAYIQVRGGGASVLDERQVYVVVPATTVPLG